MELSVAASARVLGRFAAGPGSHVAQGAILRGSHGGVRLGAGSAVLENCVFVDTPTHACTIGERTVFGHRAVVVGATIGDLCEIGNGAIIGEGAQLGDRCFLGEGTLVPAGTAVPDDSVLVGRPARRIRTANSGDIERLLMLRGGNLEVPAAGTHDHPPTTTAHGDHTMGQLYAYRDKTPAIGTGTVLFDSAEVTGDVIIGDDCIIGAGVKIVGDSHGPVRIGDRVQILENTVLHLLPDNELVIGDDVHIGPAAMIHGCHIGAGSVIDAAAIICDGVVLGHECHVTTGSLVPQRAEHPARTRLEGFPAKPTTLDAAPSAPGWAIDPDDLPRRVLP